MAYITTSSRFSGAGRTIFLCSVTVAAITALSARCFAQLSTDSVSEVRADGPNSPASYADEGLGSLRHISTAPAPPRLLSLADVAPGLLPFFNNAPVFSLPGTVEGNFWHRTQLLGGLNGRRTDLANHGVFIDVYSTGYYQNVTSGGLKTGSAYVQNTQASINLDTGRAGLWSGGLFHFTVQSRYGSSPENTFTVGSFVPQYVGLVLPGALLSSDTLPSEYFLTQALTKKFAVVLGVISDIFIPDETLFGNSYKYYFANFNFNKNPMTTNFYEPTSLAALGAWTAKPWLLVAGGVTDPFTRSNTLEDVFHHGVNLYATAIVSYQLRGRPGQTAPSFNWSNQPQIDLESPFGPLAPAQVPAAVGALLGTTPTAGLPVNFKDNSTFTISSISQYLTVKEPDAATVGEKLKSGQQLRGLGVFGRVGYAPRSTNTLTGDASAALFARGLWDNRQDDSFGAGFYYNAISGLFKNAIEQLTAGTRLKNEKGIEVFYDFAITPAIRVEPGYQHVWDPLIAAVAVKENHADLFQLRFNVAW
jgi:porin